MAKIRTIIPNFRTKEKNKKPIYPISNENFIPVKKNLESFKGFQYYIGICGGGTQNIFLLSLLTKNNKFKKISLVDKKISALVNFTYIAKAYNKSKDDLHYFSNTIKAYRRFKVNYIPYFRFFLPMFRYKSYGFEETNFKYYQLKKDLTIYLEKADMVEYIRNLPSGKYFIYLSNILTFGFTPFLSGMSPSLWAKYICYWLIDLVKHIKNHTNKEWSLEVHLDYILSVVQPLIAKSNNILNGSLVLIEVSFSQKAKCNYLIIFKKYADKLVVSKTCKVKR